MLIFDGMVSGSGSVVQAGTGTTILTGANSYTGGTTISAGTLQIGNGGSSGSIAGDVVDNGMLTFDRSDTLAFGGVISGAGSLLQAGAGTTILTGANSYAGGTTISAGTLQIGDGGTTGSIIGNVADNGALVFNRVDGITFGGVISGTGTLGQIGAGTLTLTGINSHTGGTIVSAGTLAITTDLNLGAASAPLTLDGGRLLTNAAISSARPVTLAAGGGTIDNGGFADLFSGPVTGPGALTVTGAGIVTLAADNAYTGGTTIAAGTLRLGDGGTTGSITGDVANERHFGVRSLERPGLRRRHQRHGRRRPAGCRHDDPHGGQHLYGRDQRRRRAAAGRRIDRGTGAGGRRRAAGRHRQHRRRRDHRRRRTAWRRARASAR